MTVISSENVLLQDIYVNNTSNHPVRITILHILLALKEEEYS